MSVVPHLWLAALAVLLLSCTKPDDAARLASLRSTVDELVGAQTGMLSREKAKIEDGISTRGKWPAHLALGERATRTYIATQRVLNQLDSLQKEFTAAAGPGTGASTPDDGGSRYPAREHGAELDRLEQNVRGLVAVLEPRAAGRAAGMVGPEGALARLRSGEMSRAVALALLWEMKLETVGCALTGLESLNASLTTGEEMLPYPVVALPAVLPEGDSLHVGVVLRGFMPRPAKGVLEMTCNGKPVIIEQGIGKVRFIAQGPPGTKHWEAAIRVKLPHGNRDTVFRATQTYRVLPR